VSVRVRPPAPILHNWSVSELWLSQQFEFRHAVSIRDRLDGAAVFAPSLLRYELASVAWKKAPACVTATGLAADRSVPRKCGREANDPFIRLDHLPPAAGNKLYRRDGS
jgi:hypothetical protein